MARYIDATALSKAVFESMKENPHTDSIVRRTHHHEHEHFLRMIDNVPTIDVAEVVRCMHCQHFKTNINKENYCDIHSTTWDKFYVRDDDYCSYGRRIRGD